VDVVGRRRQVQADADAAATSQGQGGLFAGINGETAAGWSVSGSFGYVGSRLDVAERRSSAKVQSVSLALAAARRFDSPWGALDVLGGLAHASHEVQTTRDIAPAGLPQTLEAEYRARSLDVFGELGLAIPVAARTTAQPFVGVAWSQVTQPAFQESGGSAALQAERQRSDSSTSMLGLRMQQRLDDGGLLHASLGWRHANGAYRGTAILSFPGSQPYAISGAAVARDSGVLQVGTLLNLGPNASLGLDYGAQFGAGGREHGGRIVFNWRL